MIQEGAIGDGTGDLKLGGNPVADASTAPAMRSRTVPPSPMELLSLPENPIPNGAVVVPLRTADGVTLRAARFPSARNVRPAGTVCLFHGRGEQIEKYFPVIERLQRRGLTVATLDWRGQGGSQRLTRNPVKGHVSDFRHYERDIEAFRRHLALPDCPPPFFGLAHSMGANILLRAAPRLTPWLSRLVLASPLLDFGVTPMRRAGIRRTATILRWFALGKAFIPKSTRRYALAGGFEGNPLTSDPERFAALKAIAAARPDLGIGAPTVGWMGAAARSMDAIDDDRFPASVRVPILLVNAGADVIVSVRAVERMARRLRGCAYVLVPGARHELMFESDLYAAQFWAAFDAFVPGGGPV